MEGSVWIVAVPLWAIVFALTRIAGMLVRLEHKARSVTMNDVAQAGR